jgi:hypothetical protein
LSRERELPSKYQISSGHMPAQRARMARRGAVEQQHRARSSRMPPYSWRTISSRLLPVLAEFVARGVGIGVAHFPEAVDEASRW